MVLSMMAKDSWGLGWTQYLHRVDDGAGQQGVDSVPHCGRGGLKKMCQVIGNPFYSVLEPS